MNVYVSIGNSDDKLSQAKWAEYILEVREVLRGSASKVLGEWYSASDSNWQNACFCITIPDQKIASEAKLKLTKIRKRFGQDSVAWSDVSNTQFI
jgi:hypothetical protein